MMTLTPPCTRSAAPLPATALPSINTEEVGAAVHNAEPAVKTSARQSRAWPTGGHLRTLEDNKSRKMNNFRVEEFVDCTTSWLECSQLDQISRSIPANISEWVEFGRDLRTAR